MAALPVTIRLGSANVISVHDGDTFDSMLDIGWGIVLRPRGKKMTKAGGGGTIRVVAADGSPYDAPELTTIRGKTAAAFAQTLVGPGTWVEVVSYGLDDFGRTLGAVTLPDGRDWAAVMTEAGYVK